MKRKMKREDEREDKKEGEERESCFFFFFEQLFENPQTRQMNQPKMFRKKIPFG